MFVLVSFGKLAVSVCQGVTLGNLVCEPVSLIDVSVSSSLSPVSQTVSVKAGK